MTTTFTDCLMMAAANKELVANYDRLCGTNLIMEGSLLELMTDKATGRQDAELEAFVDFVWECIWVPLVVNHD